MYLVVTPIRAESSDFIRGVIGFSWVAGRVGDLCVLDVFSVTGVAGVGDRDKL